MTGARARVTMGLLRRGRHGLSVGEGWDEGWVEGLRLLGMCEECAASEASASVCLCVYSSGIP